MNHRKQIAFLVVALLIGGGFHLVRHVGKESPKPRTERAEVEIGQTLAALIREATPAHTPTTILYLFPIDAKPYTARAESLREALEEHAGTVQEVWAREDGHYNDDDFTSSIDITLKEHPNTGVLVIVSIGGVTHARVSPALKAFIKDGGHLYLHGDAGKEDAPFVKMAEHGYATLLASRTTWLKDSPVNPALASAPVNVQNSFTLISASAD